MKNLKFKEIYLISNVERKARKIVFSPHLNIILGKNRNGKSSLLKSLYWTMGADPAKMHEKWINANITSLLKISVDEKIFFVLRKDNYISFFDENKNILLKTKKGEITSKVAPFIANLLDFKLELNERNSLKSNYAPPSYCFSPFYIDQDSGWQNTIASFSGLLQYKDYKKHIIEYHTGILPKEYYEYKAKLEKANLAIKEKENEFNIINSTLQRIVSMTNLLPLEFDQDKYKEEIDTILNEFSKLEKEQFEYRNKISTINNEILSLRQQIDLAKKTVKELDKDIVTSTELSEEIICPTCGGHYDNSYITTFSIIDNMYTCTDFIIDGENKILANEKEIIKIKEKYLKNNIHADKIKEVLSIKKEKLKLSELLEAEGKKYTIKSLKESLKELNEVISKHKNTAKEMSEKLKDYNDSKHKKNINEFYLKQMKNNLLRLNLLEEISENIYKKIVSRINETGSTLPKVILSYFMAIIKTIREFSTSCICPIVIDSPRQQDADKISYDKILDLIVNNKLDDCQIIVATTIMDDYSTPDNTTILELTDKYLLLDSEYEEIKNKVKEFSHRALF